MLINDNKDQSYFQDFQSRANATLYVTMSVGPLVTTQFVIDFLIVLDRFFCEILFGQFFFFLKKIFVFFFLSFLSFFVIFMLSFTFYCPCPATRDQGQPCIRPCSYQHRQYHCLAMHLFHEQMYTTTIRRTTLFDAHFQYENTFYLH